MGLPTHTAWGLAWESAAHIPDATLRFDAHYRAIPDDRVTIYFCRLRTSVDDPELKADPRPHTEVLLPALCSTGEMVRVIQIPRYSITLSVLPIALQDTEDRRQHRWRLRPDLVDAVPSELSEMVGGRQHGQIRRSSDES